jgi:hypothetical protein
LAVKKNNLYKSRIRYIQLTLIIGGILLGLIVLEVTLRSLPSPPTLFENYGDTYICSPTLGWSGRPDYQGILTREEYSHPIRFNSIGMYDTNHTLQKEDNVFRILWMGDSFAQALQVDELQTAHQQLEDLLNQRLGSPERSFEVINTGVMGWGPAQALVYYREQGRLYQPDLVLHLFFVGNDVNDNLPGHALTIGGFNCFAPYFPVCDNSSLDPEPWYYIPGLDPAWHSCSPAHKWLASGLNLVRYHSYLFARIEPLLLSLNPRRTYGQEFGLPFAALYLPEESDEVRYGWQVTEGVLAQFNEEVGADGADFAVAMVGPREVVWLSQLTGSQLQSFYQSDPVFSEAEIDWPNRRLTGFLKSHNIHVLDLQQPMVNYITESGTQLYLPIDRHWTLEGNRLAAELIFGWLVDNDLLED